MSTFQKYKYILEAFHTKKSLSADDEALLDELQISSKQLGRLFHELDNIFDNIIKEKEGKKNIYKLIRPIDLFVETFKNSNELGWFFEMAHEANPEIFKALESYTNQNPKIYQFKTSPFEDINTFDAKEIFNQLRLAVEAREYRKIKFTYEETFRDNLKCLKLIFMDNNWYIAYVDEEEKLRFGRISFIDKMSYATKSTAYQPATVAKHLKFLESVQNSKTIFDVTPNIATLKATPEVAHYFDKGMKRFLSSQAFVRKELDGSVIFTLSYTQSIEILPLVQRWLPNLIILKPKELADEYAKKLSETIKYQNSIDTQ